MMMDVDALYDEQMARAIEESMKEQKKPNPEDDIIVISSDEEDAPAKPPPPPKPKEKTAANSFLSERAQMEKERRERVRQRRLAQGLKDEEEEPDKGDEAEVAAPPPKRATPSSSKPTDPLFFEGELRPTAVSGGEPRLDGKPTFRLSEVLGNKSDISFAILSSYASDIAWMHGFFEHGTPVIFVDQPDQGKSFEIQMKYVLPGWIRLTPKLHGPYGCQHMKYMVLFYNTGRMRVVVSSANLIPIDWSILENVVWLQDLPPRASAIPHDPKATDDFAAVLQRILKYMGVGDALAILRTEHPKLPLESINDLRRRWDFSKVKAHLIPSLAGKHEGWPTVIQTGHTRLMKAIMDMKLGSRPGDLSLEYQGSSIGLYSKSWLNEFYNSALGRSGEDLLKNKARYRDKPVAGKISIVYPSRTTVRASKRGEPGGGTMFCKRAYWAKLNEMGSNVGMFDSKSKAGPVLMHTKMILGLLKQEEEDEGEEEEFEVGKVDARAKARLQEKRSQKGKNREKEKPLGWAYIGSHNFTPSAWGTLSGSAFNPALSIKNYELGIVFPINSEAELERITLWERPLRKYGSGDVPWIQEESLAFA
ncbi:phospholipase D/nuclease [Cylindrobasidium torrendii FP15055 ss-10]|uniref:Phospholipase D/nuclease n=1 Tax=Cylindrobasidium torrendii FP15055 ss-10 TaxID=1314674 RepID=A0A0D7BH70_9AGAR|nr:phospholipase D/nuclease [Cylindrobasidium torrendii FP15055 ss-10]